MPPHCPHSAAPEVDPAAEEVVVVVEVFKVVADEAFVDVETWELELELELLERVPVNVLLIGPTRMFE